MNVDRGGSGEPMVLIHGLGSNLRVWSAVTPALRERHDVLAIDLPGFGESPPLEGEVTGPALADAAEAALDEAGFERAHLVGNSLGGYVVAQLARRGRALSAAAISPWGLHTRRERAYSTATLISLRRTTRALSPVADTFARFAPIRTILALQGIGPHGWRVDPEELAHAVRSYASAPGFEPTLAWMSHHGADGLEQIDCPFLVLWGTLDLLLPVRQGPRWERLIPGAELRRLPGYGHAPMPEAPELVSGALLDFAARRPASRDAAPA
jgi:pimeloyl-ACP methyl ester carboxylesterase